MKNKLSDLNDHLFAQIERLSKTMPAGAIVKSVRLTLSAPDFRTDFPLSDRNSPNRPENHEQDRSNMAGHFARNVQNSILRAACRASNLTIERGTTRFNRFAQLEHRHFLVRQKKIVTLHFAELVPLKYQLAKGIMKVLLLRLIAGLSRPHDTINFRYSCRHATHDGRNPSPVISGFKRLLSVPHNDRHQYRNQNCEKRAAPLNHGKRAGMAFHPAEPSVRLHRACVPAHIHLQRKPSISHSILSRTSRASR